MFINNFMGSPFVVKSGVLSKGFWIWGGVIVEIQNFLSFVTSRIKLLQHQRHS